jgi:N-acetylmuramoyl-L-alanine amidase
VKKSAILFLTFITFIVIIGGLGCTINYINEKDIIYIDPGHGGFDGGASSNDKKILEKDLVLNISLKLKYYLEQIGYKVLLTRDRDIALSNTKTKDIHKRVSLINNSHCLLYISIHANSYPSEKIKGAQTFYNPNSDNNKQLALSIMEQLHNIDPYNTRKEKSLKGKYLLDKVEKVGCLIEVGFLTNNQELNLLIDDVYQEKLAYSIYLGIINYFNKSGE